MSRLCVFRPLFTVVSREASGRAGTILCLLWQGASLSLELSSASFSRHRLHHAEDWDSLLAEERERSLVSIWTRANAFLTMESAAVCVCVCVRVREKKRACC